MPEINNCLTCRWEVPPSINGEIEEWRVFARHERYLISTLGRVWNMNRKKFVYIGEGRKGYLRFKIFPECKKGKYTNILLHRAVLETFLGECPEGCECSHLNGDKSDNRLVNLCYESKSQNNARKIITGKLCQGSRHPRAKLTEDLVLKARGEWRPGVQGHGSCVLAKKYGVDTSTMWAALTGKHWSNAHQPKAKE